MSDMLRRLLGLLFFIVLIAAVLGAAETHPSRLDPVLRALSSPEFRSTVAPGQMVQSLALAWDGVRLPPVHLQEELTPAQLGELPIGAWEDAQVGVLVLTHAAHTDSLPGLVIQGSHGPVLTGLADVVQLQALAEHPAVAYVEAARPVSPRLDVSIGEVRADQAWTGPRETTGEGVIIGVVDTGLDLMHPDFRVDRTGDGQAEGTRVLSLWDQGQSYDGSAGPYGFFYGRVYARGQLEQRIAIGNPPSRDDTPAYGGHGTHVAGIAAGGGAAGLPGVAPDAELVVVKTTFSTKDVVDAVDFVFQVADDHGLPAVVNLSLGTHSGPHDGTSLFDRGISELLVENGRSIAGRAVVVAAGNEGEGNEGDKRIHVGANVGATTTWDLQARESTVEVEFWHDGDASFAVTVTAPGGESVTAWPGHTAGLNTPSGNVYLDNPLERDPRNDDKEIYLALTNAAQQSQWAITLDPLDQGGRVDAWVTRDQAGRFPQGDSNFTISEPATAHRVIAVGAYTTKNTWQSVDTQPNYTVGALASFSSRGPTRDGRPKPDLTAPGAWIAAPLSAPVEGHVPGWLRLPGGEYRMQAGTSMSAPHVAGAAALLLSAEQNLDWQEVADALIESARRDQYTGSPTRWGAGKLDAAAAVERLPEEVLPPLPEDRPELELLRNPVSTESPMRYRLPEGTDRGRLHVYDLTGRRIFTQEITDEQGELVWGLHTDWNRLVADGLYLVVLVTDQQTSEIQRLVVHR